MTHESLRDLIVGELTRIAPDTDPAAIAPEASLRDELDLDSMDFLAFVTALHDRLGIEVPEADYRKIDSIAGCVAYLAERTAAP